MLNKRIVRETISVCPFCFENVDGRLFETDNTIYLEKLCANHGQTDILITRKPDYYRKLEEFYFSTMNEEKKLKNISIYLTFKCNMNCPICYLGTPEDRTGGFEPSRTKIEDFAKKSKYSTFELTGGEPTLREDLPQIIRSLKKYSKAVSINTNGLKIADFNYLRILKESGLDRVNIQLDGFCSEVELLFRGQDFLNIKKKSLENLKNLNIATGINAVVARGINEDKLKDLMDFGLKNNFIKTINFLTMIYIGGARRLPLQNYIMPDELIDLIEEQTNGALARKNIFMFQKLHLASKSFFSQKFCLYSQSYVVIRNKKGFSGIDNFLNLNKSNFWLDRYGWAFKNNKRHLSFVFFVISVTCLFVRLKALFIIKELFLSGLSYFLKTDYYLKSRKFFYINFTTACDPYKIDLRLVKNCHNEVACIDDDERNKTICSALFYMNREKCWFANHFR